MNSHEAHLQHQVALETLDVVEEHLQQTFDLPKLAAALQAPYTSPVSMRAFERPLPFAKLPNFRPMLFETQYGVQPSPIQKLNVPGAPRAYDKREDLQAPGRNHTLFSARYAALHTLNDSPGARVLATATTGNHGISLAHTVNQLNSRLPGNLQREAHVYCPGEISQQKLDLLKELGARVFATYETLEDAIAAANAATHDRPNSANIPPFDHPLVIAGQAAATLLMFVQLKNSKADLPRNNFMLYEPVGGGSKMSGASIAVRKLMEWGVIGSDSAVVGVEVEQNDSNARALAGRPSLVRGASPLSSPDVLDTDCDGTATVATGYYTLPVMREFSDGITVIPKHFLVDACGRLMQSHEGSPPELAGALSLGGLLYDIASGKDSRYATHTVLTTTTGANVSRELLGKVADECLADDGATIESHIASLNLRRYAEGIATTALLKSGGQEAKPSKADTRQLNVWKGLHRA